MLSSPSTRRLARFTLALLVVIPLHGQAHAQTSRNVELLYQLDRDVRHSACWSYVHHDGREYAVLGTFTGVSIVNITDPRNAYEVAFFYGLASVSREAKQYRSYIYVSADTHPAGIQIIRMTDPEHPALVKTYLGTFTATHTVQVDTTRALLYCNSTRIANIDRGLRILSLADPENPVEVGRYEAVGYHDTFPVGNLLYGFSIGDQRVEILDVSDPAALLVLASWTYPFAASHSGEPSPDGRYLYVCDEVGEANMKVFDLARLPDPPIVNELTANPLGVVHNVHVKGNIAYLAHYTEGVRLWDITDPSLPAEIGFYDTFPGRTGGFHGVWEVAPHYPSGRFIVSDIETGLYVFEPKLDYGSIKLSIVDEAGHPVSGADVLVVGRTDSTATNDRGLARLALEPGGYELRIRRFSYPTQRIPISIASGVHDSIQVLLRLPEPGSIAGFVRNALDQSPIADALIRIQETPLQGISGAEGRYTVGGVPPGDHRLTCSRPGFVPRAREAPVASGRVTAASWQLRPAFWYDPAEEDRGWSLEAPDDDATPEGRWIRAEPVASGLPTHPIQPGEDHTPGAGRLCFVTGNASSAFDLVYVADVDRGRTTLISPPLDLSSLEDPIVGFWYWVALIDYLDQFEIFPIDVSADDGVTWMNARTIDRSSREWRYDEIRIRDHVAPSDRVRIRFVARDLTTFFDPTIEAAVDDIQVYDAALPDPVDLLTVGVDVKPGACPNRVREASLGRIPVTILGSAGFDPGSLVPESIRLAGVAAAHVSPESEALDSSAPSGGGCDCSGYETDAFPDRVIHFEWEALRAAIGPVEPGEPVSLELTATLRDGTPVVGSDCVQVMGSRPAPSAAAPRTLVRPGHPGVFSYAVPHPGASVRARVFSASGQLVAELVDEFQAPGSRSIRWNGLNRNGRPAASGVYVLRLDVGREGRSYRTIVLR